MTVVAQDAAGLLSVKGGWPNRRSVWMTGVQPVNVKNPGPLPS
ncbi:hypothetical protein [Streptomyces sp. LN549]